MLFLHLTPLQLRVFSALYVSYALSLVVKRNYAFWVPALVSGGWASASGVGLLGFAYESANGVAKVAGAVLVDLFPPSLVLAASLAAQGLNLVGIYLSAAAALSFAALLLLRKPALD